MYRIYYNLLNKNYTLRIEVQAAMNVIEYFGTDDREYWLSKIESANWLMYDVETELRSARALDIVSIVSFHSAGSGAPLIMLSATPLRPSWISLSVSVSSLPFSGDKMSASTASEISLIVSAKWVPYNPIMKEPTAGQCRMYF